MVGLNEGSNMNKNIMGYFKSIQTFIRSLFYKQQEQTKQNKCTLQHEKYLKIGANICNIGFKSKHAYEDWQEDIFNQISVGNLVYCTMPVTDKALKTIPEGHTTRPFLIVKKGKDELYGYACATHPKSLRSYEKHIFTNEVYVLKTLVTKILLCNLIVLMSFLLHISNIFIKNWMNIVYVRLPEN